MQWIPDTNLHACIDLCSIFNVRLPYGGELGFCSMCSGVTVKTNGTCQLKSGVETGAINANKIGTGQICDAQSRRFLESKGVGRLAWSLFWDGVLGVFEKSKSTCKRRGGWFEVEVFIIIDLENPALRCTRCDSSALKGLFPLSPLLQLLQCYVCT